LELTRMDSVVWPTFAFAVCKVVPVEVLTVATSVIAKGAGRPNGITVWGAPVVVAARADGVEVAPVSAMARPPPSVATDTPTPTMAIVMRKFLMVSLLLFELTYCWFGSGERRSASASSVLGT
jgi:hypothetical protein